MKKRVYVDMDGVLVDYESGFDGTPDELHGYDNTPNVFSKMLPLPGALEAFRTLAEKFDVYVLSTAPWNNPSAWTDKANWIKKYLGDVAHKRLILTHNKALCIGDYLIDDRTANGAGEFTGRHIHFGTDRFPDWDTVLAYLDKEE
jgi:5'(3')-deoxyribonucleotidase